MKEEDEVITSPLSRALDLEGKRLLINIYRGTYTDDDWVLEVVDSDGHSHVSNEMYFTDEQALEAAIRIVRDDQGQIVSGTASEVFRP